MIIRKSKRRRFTSLSNQLLQDRNLSFAVRGLLAYLLSKPDDWECRMTDIEREGNIGTTARRTMMIEAEKAGYLTFERARNEKGQFQSAYTVHEEPMPEGERTRSWESGANLETDEPATDDPPLDNPRVDGIGDIERKKVLQKTDLQKTDKAKPANPSHHPAIQLFRKITNRYPDKALYPKVISVLGDTPNDELATRCYSEWISHGWNKMNLAWLFDWYPKGEPQQIGRKINTQFAGKTGNGINAANSTPDEFAAEVQRIHDAKYGQVIEMEAIQ